MSGPPKNGIAPAVRHRRDLRAEIFSLVDHEPVRLRSVLVATLGMGVPVIVGLSSDRAGAGFTIGLGAILLSDAPWGAGAPSKDKNRPSTMILPAMLAVIVATLIAGRVWTDATMIGLVSLAALSSGFSRPQAVGAIRFSIYLVLGVGFLDGAGSGHKGAALVFGLGALWTTLLRRLLADRTTTPEETMRATHVLTLGQRWTPFRRTVKSLAGWQFAARLALGLTVASVIGHLCPERHFYWIMLTVILLTQRPIEHVPVKTVQRLLGTIAGVGITWLVVMAVHSPMILAVFACLLATLVPIVRARSYLLYSVVATPLILMVLDLGKPITVALLTDRVVATTIGGILVAVANILADRLLNTRRDRSTATVSMPR